MIFEKSGAIEIKFSTATQTENQYGLVLTGS